MISLLFKKKEEKKKEDNLPDLKWEKSPSGKFYRLITINENAPGLINQGGVLLIWAKWAKRTIWLHVGSSSNLSKSLALAKENKEILQYNEKGGVGVTWALVNPRYINGITKYLKESLKPELEIKDLDDSVNFDNEKPYPVKIPIV
ncbi:MAG: hypothetical protein BWY78_01407 [Alphaproteobacteria bacterium ADurb.Bin438]|nr:MAG: hypothetical protein BWY78_01407 [Alphaproteobacteria bacterium ADurb.Bin438]